jgi:hypothetical protein
MTKKMIPLAGLFRGIFLIVILLWYSLSVWHAMDGYFREEFKKYLEKEYERNEHLKADTVAKIYGSEAESVRSVHTTTFQQQIGNIATSFTKFDHADVIKEKHIQIKREHIQDTPKCSAPKLESALKFMGANTSSHVSAVHDAECCQKRNEKCCTLTSDVLNNENKCQ